MGQDFQKSPVLIGQTPQTMFDSESLSKNFCSIKQFQKEGNETMFDLKHPQQNILSQDTGLNKIQNII